MALPPTLDRRTTLKWIAAAGALPLLHAGPLGAAGRSVSAGSVAPEGYGTDPNLLKEYHPGELWPLTLDEPARRVSAKLCDIIIPADARSPSASSVHVVDFIDEWISAPYPHYREDRKLILFGFDWLEQEARRRNDKGFLDLGPDEYHAICDDICYAAKVPRKLTQAAKFFARYRDLTAGGFYTTPEGTRDLGYIGNVPLAKFEGPPPELLKRLGLD